MSSSAGSVSPPESRRPGRGSILLSVLGSAVVGCVVAWWITVAQRVPVLSDADLADVRFGFPLPWITQDHSSNPFAAYPADVALRLTGRTGIPYPTTYDWLPFIGDALIWGAAAWALGMLVLPAVVRTMRARSEP
ncbi:MULTISPECIES: hypothetical protein [unclassified Microbacterium]|uniref:hypothetical protein n=1 Tax=unclassified Microbacterium TaxID=2609290 RepID=UPI00109C7703|nr:MULTISPECIES: hypothetical protein [unclassified Microbacterium]